jgi:hypothetical protein
LKSGHFDPAGKNACPTENFGATSAHARFGGNKLFAPASVTRLGSKSPRNGTLGTDANFFSSAGHALLLRSKLQAHGGA